MAKEKTETIFPVASGVAGQTVTFDFDGTYEYYDRPVNRTFENSLIDNVGDGKVRISFKGGLQLYNPIDGAKTLRPGDALSITTSIRHITIYFIEDSVVEMVLISD